MSPQLNRWAHDSHGPKRPAPWGRRGADIAARAHAATEPRTHARGLGPSRERAWRAGLLSLPLSVSALFSAVSVTDLWTAAPQGPEEPRKVPKSTQAGVWRVCPTERDTTPSRQLLTNRVLESRNWSKRSAPGGHLLRPEPGRQPPSREEFCAEGPRNPQRPILHSGIAGGFLWLGGGAHPNLLPCHPKPRSSCPEPHCGQPGRHTWNILSLHSGLTRSSSVRVHSKTSCKGGPSSSMRGTSLSSTWCPCGLWGQGLCPCTELGLQQRYISLR